MKEHIVTTYDEDLNSLKSNLTKMGLNVEKQIFQAVDLIKIINISSINGYFFYLKLVFANPFWNVIRSNT